MLLSAAEFISNQYNWFRAGNKMVGFWVEEHEMDALPWPLLSASLLPRNLFICFWHFCHEALRRCICSLTEFAKPELSVFTCLGGGCLNTCKTVKALDVYWELLYEEDESSGWWRKMRSSVSLTWGGKKPSGCLIMYRMKSLFLCFKCTQHTLCVAAMWTMLNKTLR